MATPRTPRGELLTLPHVCRILGISVPKAAKAAEQGEFVPVIKIGAHRYVSRRAFDEWFTKNVRPQSAA